MADAKKILLEGIERWNAHDREGVLALYDEDVIFVDEPTGRQLSGREQLGKGFYDLWTDAYPDNVIKEARVVADGDVVCLEAHFVGTNTGPFHVPDFELPATGKSIDAPFVLVNEIRDGKIKMVRHYYDRLLAFEQEGMITVEALVEQLSPA